MVPFQSGLRMRRWLCSVCDSMRVHVLRSAVALFTVCDTVWPARVSQLATVW